MRPSVWCFDGNGRNLQKFSLQLTGYFVALRTFYSVTLRKSLALRYTSPMPTTNRKRPSWSRVIAPDTKVLESSRLTKHSGVGRRACIKKPTSVKASSASETAHGTPDGDKASERDMPQGSEETCWRSTATPRRCGLYGAEAYRDAKTRKALGHSSEWHPSSGLAISNEVSPGLGTSPTQSAWLMGLVTRRY